MMKAILLDIEGTTTPIDFVHKKLFPYSKERIADFIERQFNDLQEIISQLEEECRNDAGYANEFKTDLPASVAKYLEFLIDNDRKSTPLKAIQGMIWRAGYESGDLISQVFADVYEALEKWKGQGKVIAIYSSGSARAQQLLFRYTERGDLTHLIDAYFDTTIGGKREAESYRKIADMLSLAPKSIMFISDVLAELEAAKAAGMKTALSIRPGNAPLPAEAESAAEHPVIRNLSELFV